MELDVEKVKKLTKPRDKAASLDIGRYQKKIKGNEYLELQMETSLVNQMAEKNAVQRLTYENEKLKIHHNDMQVKYDKMQSEYNNLTDDLKYLKETEERQRQHIARLTQEIEELRMTGGNQYLKDVQDRLIRLSNDQAEKDMRIHKLEMLLETGSEDRNTNTNANTQSAVCVVL